MRSYRGQAEALFDNAATAQLVAILGCKGNAEASAFQADLIDLCAHYREVIATLPCDLPDAPFNMSLTKRADWLEANVLNPGERLLNAISVDMRPMFSTWPYPLAVPDFRGNALLAAQLTELLSSARDLQRSLRAQQSDDAGHSQEIRAEIFGSLARLFRKHYPEVPPNRGVNDPEIGGGSGGRSGVYVDAMRFAYQRVTGRNDNLDRLIRGEISFPS